MSETFRLAAAILLLATADCARAQSETGELPSPSLVPNTVQFDHLSLDEGLSQSSVHDIHQDRQGFIWLATQDGLNRYDGREFKVFKTVPFDSTSFASSWIWSVAEAPNGMLWVGTRTGGLNRFDPLTGLVKRYLHDPDDSTSLSSNFVFTVEVDSKGVVWAGTQEGLNRLNTRTDTFTRFAPDSTDGTSIGREFVTSIYEDESGELWVGTGNGLNRFHGDSGTFTRYMVDPAADVVHERIMDAMVTDITGDPADPNLLWLSGGFGLARFDKRTGLHRFFAPPGDVEDLLRLARDPGIPGVLWATSDGGGLMRFDSRTEEFTVFRHDPGDPTSLGHDALFSIDADRTGMMWVDAQAHAGVDKFDPSVGGFINYKQRAGDDASLSPNTVWGVYVQPSNSEVVWSTHQNDPQRSHDRLNRIDRRTGRVEHFVHQPGNPESLGLGQVPTLLEDRNGRLWIATLGGGLNIFLPERRAFRRYTPTEEATSISSDRVSAIVEDQAGTLWIGTLGGGVNRMDPSRPGVFRRFQESSSDSSSLLGSEVDAHGLSVAPDGGVWVGTEKGLNRIDPSTGSVRRFRHAPNDPNSLAAPHVTAVHADLTGAVWAVTLAQDRNDVNRLDPETGTFTRYTHDPGDPTSLSDAHISTRYERPEEPGVLWIGYPAGGLTRIDPTADSLVHYTEADGLPNNFVYGILSDDDGRLWLSTNNGLSRFDPDTERFRNFDVDDGLLSREFNSHAYHRSKSGLMAFGSIGGVTMFDPADIRPNRIPPSVVLTELRLLNRPVQPGPGSVLASPLSETSEIRLSHWQKTLTFEFVALHFRNPERNTYSYMLQGFDEDWVAAGTRRTATYTNLDPGTYSFRVRAANSDGIWNEEGTSIAIVVAPPYWKTSWFRLLVLLGVIGIGFTLYRTRVRHMAARNRQLESQVDRRTAELQSKNAQLEQSHAIVSAINAETAFRSLLSAVLEQTRVIPGVEKASALVYSSAHNAYVFQASTGWEVSVLERIRMTEEEAHARYVEHAEEVADDVFLERDVAHRPGHELLSGLPTPASMLVMRVRSTDRVEGYLVFDNMRDRDAFDRHDLELLIRLREHVRSAFVKTRLLEDLRRSLEHLTATQNQLVQAEKMASLGQLTAGIAHEIKNPLNFINNFAALCGDLARELDESLQARGAVDEELRRIIDDLRLNSAKIQEHGKRADGIVRSMLRHSRARSGEMEEADLNVLLDEYVNLAFHGMKAREVDFHVAIDRAYDPSVGKLRLIPQEIGRVVINLLDNAFYAVRRRARFQNGEYVPQVRVGTQRANGAVQIQVADNGTGIPDDVRERIFEPFFTTKPTGEGTGLGLSMSYDIVTQIHGGRISVESHEGEGTTFTITMPAE